jgi:ATP-dependent RNA helicase RhlE
VAGVAISFVDVADVLHFKVIQKKMNKWVELVDSQDFNLHGFY